MAKTLDAARSEIRNRLQRWDKMDTTLLFEINFGRIRTRWKGKFVHFVMEQCFSTGSVLEIERKKIVKMRQQWDNEELKEATTTWSNDWDHDLVQEEVEGKLRQQRWRHIENDIHTHEGRTSRIARWFIFSFYAKHHAKHGGGFCGQARMISWSKIITVATRCSWFFFHA